VTVAGCPPIEIAGVDTVVDEASVAGQRPRAVIDRPQSIEEQLHRAPARHRVAGGNHRVAQIQSRRTNCPFDWDEKNPGE